MKKGITMAVILIAIVIMMVLVTSASVVGAGAISSANYEEFKSSLSRVSDAANEYEITYKALPIKNEVVSTYSLGESFKKELDARNDFNEKLLVIDLQKVNDPTITKGHGTVANQDVFVISENTKNVYYLKGYRYKSKMYYGIQNDTVISKSEENPSVTPGEVQKKNKIYTDPTGKEAMIPKGFKVSTMNTEQTISSGLVVIAADNSQFVWVPVPDITSYIDTASQRSKLTEWSTETSVAGNPISYNELSYHEPDLVSTQDANNLDKLNSLLGQSFANDAAFKAYLVAEWKAIYTSIKENKGFYIGRYETGDLSASTVVSKSGNTDIWNSSSTLWYGMYAKQKKYASTLSGTNVKSNMIYGFQWDATMKWFATSGNSMVKNFSIEAPAAYSNFSGGKKSTGSLLPINNIYDMAGNAVEWTVETANGTSRTTRGSAYNFSEYAQCAGYRNYTNAVISTDNIIGTRLALYL